MFCATSLSPFTASIMPAESEMSPPVRWPPSYYLSSPNPKSGGRAPCNIFANTLDNTLFSPEERLPSYCHSSVESLCLCFVQCS
jgi:hypothetical protein